MSNFYLPGVIAIPSALLITEITRAYPMVVSVEVGNEATSANTYIVGMLVKLTVPRSYGMFQANGLQGEILSITGSDFALKLDSSLFDLFVIPSGIRVEQPASISPAGSRNLQYSNLTRDVPFQSLNNIGN
jgi:hypothetical protein